jgi:hypothetical protein
MRGFKKDDDFKSEVQRIINQEEVGKLLKKYKKLKKFKKSNIHAVNQLDGRKDIIQELMDEYMEDK